MTRNKRTGAGCVGIADKKGNFCHTLQTLPIKSKLDEIPSKINN